MTSNGDHDPTMGSPAECVQRDLAACRTLPLLSTVGPCARSEGAHTAACPAAGHHLSPLAALLLDADLAIARRAYLREAVAVAPSLTRPTVDWRDRLLADVLAGQESARG